MIPVAVAVRPEEAVVKAACATATVPETSAVTLSPGTTDTSPVPEIEIEPLTVTVPETSGFVQLLRSG